MATLEAAIAFLEQQLEAAASLAGTASPAADDDDEDDDNEPRDEHRRPTLSALPLQCVSATPHQSAAAQFELWKIEIDALSMFAACLRP